jgi:hypothetical protein
MVNGRRNWALILLFVLVGLPAAGFALWTWVTLNYSYSSGDRAGYVQKISRKGWLCKTWEGELAMANLPGTMPQIFSFSVRDENVAKQISDTIGQRVSLHYKEHRGIPTSCFGETSYFITAVNSAREQGEPTRRDAPAAPAASSTTATIPPVPH